MVIKNETQERITREQLAKFLLAIKEHDAAKRPDDVHPRLWKAQRDAMQSMADDLTEALNNYQAKREND